MLYFHIVFGLPGSGKTTFLNDFFNNGEIILDDITILSKGVLLEKYLLTTGIFDKNNKHIVIADPMLCLKENQEKLINVIEKNSTKYVVSWYFLDVNEDVCKKRAVHNSISTHNMLKNKINIDIEDLIVIKNGIKDDRRNKFKN